MNFDKYTDRSRGFIQSAQSLALREGHQQFAPEHLLKVLLDGNEAVAGLLARLLGDIEDPRQGGIEIDLSGAAAGDFRPFGERRLDG